MNFLGNTFNPFTANIGYTPHWGSELPGDSKDELFALQNKGHWLRPIQKSIHAPSNGYANMFI